MKKDLGQKPGFHRCYILNVHTVEWRSQNEFSYGGDATVKRPELDKEISDQDWDNFVYNRKSLRGKHWELWQHISGCRQWIKVERDTATHEIFNSLKANEEIS